MGIIDFTNLLNMYGNQEMALRLPETFSKLLNSFRSMYQKVS